MRYVLRVVVPGTKNIDYQADRLPAYTAEFSAAERADVLANLATIAPEVEAVRDIYNATLPSQEGRRASVECYPLYDSQDAIVSTIVYMPDASLALVPVEAIEAAPLTEAQKTASYERLARLEIAKMPQEIQDVLPAVVGG